MANDRIRVRFRFGIRFMVRARVSVNVLVRVMVKVRDSMLWPRAECQAFTKHGHWQKLKWRVFPVKNMLILTNWV